jgi:hypothetical protein
MSGTCDTCKHWQGNPEETFSGIPVGYRYCRAAGDGSMYDDDGNLLLDETAFAVGNGICSDPIATGPKFGCIHWEETKGEP